MPKITYIEENNLIILELIDSIQPKTSLEFSVFYYLKQNDMWYHHPSNDHRGTARLSFNYIYDDLNMKGIGFFKKEDKGSSQWLETHLLPNAVKINNDIMDLR